MNRAQQKFGAPIDLVVQKIFPTLNPMIQEFVREAPFAVLSTADGQGNCDASPKGGKPGFVKVLDAQRLLLPDVAGNKLFQSYQNFDTNPYVGLLFFIPGVNDTVRVNGKVTIVNKQTLDEQNVALALFKTNSPDVLFANAVTTLASW